MFSLSRFLKDPKHSESSNPEDDIARVAISEDGKIVYASENFLSLAHLPDALAQNLNVNEIIQFLDGDNDFQTLSSGAHEVLVNGHKHPFQFHFDWLTTPDQKRYLIGAQTESKSSSKAILQSLARQLFNPPGQHNTAERSPKAEPVETLGYNDFIHFSGMATDVMIVTNDFGEILRVNETFAQIFGYSLSDLQNMDFIDLFHDMDKPYIRNTIQTLTLDHEERGDVAIDFEARIITKDSEEHWIEWRYHSAGEHIYAMGHDVTAIKTQEKALKQREDQLSEAESIGGMGHWHWTIGEPVIQWSNEIYRIFGVSPQNFEPSLESMSQMVHKRDIDRVNQAFQRALIEENDYDMEFRVKQPGGDTRFIRCEGRCASDENGEVTALYGIMQDMTERILHEQKLKEAKDSAERAYAAKSQFLANMSHELRTPLNAIIGFSEMMESQLLGPLGNEKYLEYVQGIRESGGHLLDLISDILDMSKIEAGKYELALEELNVSKVIKLALHMIEGRAFDNTVKLTTDAFLNQNLTIVADRRALLQILLNLLSNAVKFSKENGNVHIECHERQDFISIKICDNGIGIPPNKLAAITNPFEQVSPHYTREHEGSGLGLSITKELVELHGGTLLIDSTMDVGTTVTVRLPYQAESKIKPSTDS